MIFKNNNKCIGCGKVSIGIKGSEYSEYSGLATVTITFPKHVNGRTIVGFYCIDCIGKIVDCIDKLKK